MVLRARRSSAIILAIAGHDPPTDLTVFVDVAINPGPCPTAVESSFQVQSFASSSQIHADRNLHNLEASEVQKPLIQYTSEQLYGLRSNNRPTDMTLFGKPKDFGIYRYRGKRAGRYRSLHSGSNQHSSFNNTRLCITGHEEPDLYNDVKTSRSYRVAVLPSVLLCNVRAIANKIDELECVCNLNSADVVCVTETWLADTIPDSAVSMKNYVLFRRDRPTHFGGIAAYINCDIPCLIVSTPTLADSPTEIL